MSIKLSPPPVIHYSSRRRLVPTILGAFALIAAALAVLALVLHWPDVFSFGIQQTFQRYSRWAFAVGASLTNSNVTGTTWVTADDAMVTIAYNYITSYLTALLPLALVSTVVTWRVARVRSFGLVATAILTVLVLALIGLGTPFCSGLFQGLGAWPSLTYPWVVLLNRVAQDLAAPVICLVITLWWAVTDWVLLPDTQAVPSDPPRRPVLSWAAVGATGAFAAVQMLAVLGALSLPGFGPDAIRGVRVGRFLLLCALFLLALAWALIALIRGRPARWSWLPVALAVPLGSEAAGGLALLLTFACRYEPTPPRAARTSPAT